MCFCIALFRIDLHLFLLIYLFFGIKYLGSINIYNYRDHLEEFDCGLKSGVWKVELGHWGNLSYLDWLPATLLKSFCLTDYMLLVWLYRVCFCFFMYQNLVFIITIIKQSEDMGYKMMCPDQPLISLKRKTLFIFIHGEVQTAMTLLSCPVSL